MAENHESGASSPYTNNGPLDTNNGPLDTNNGPLDTSNGPLVAYSCKFCFALIPRRSEPHRCPSPGAPPYLKNDSTEQLIKFLQLLDQRRDIIYK